MMIRWRVMILKMSMAYPFFIESGSDDSICWRLRAQEALILTGLNRNFNMGCNPSIIGIMLQIHSLPGVEFNLHFGF